MAEPESSTPVAAGVSATSYVNTGLSGGVAYYYTVCAVNTAGKSASSEEVSATPTFPVLPSPPTGLAATAGIGQIALSWKASSGATSYNVYRGTSPGGESVTVASALAKTTYTNTGLTNGTRYYYVVAAVNSVGTSLPSNEASATPEPSAPPAPTGLTATAGIAEISLAWSASVGATSYDVFRSTFSGGEGTTPLKTAVTTTSYTNTGLTNGVAYYYKVAAVNGGGTSPLSPEAHATP